MVAQGLPGAPPTVAESYDRRLVAMAVQQAVEAQQPGEALPYFYRQDDKEWGDTKEAFVKRAGESIKEFWDTRFEQEMGQFKGHQLYELMQAHEPLFIKDPFTGVDMVDPMTGEPIPGPWLEVLYGLCRYQADKWLREYANVQLDMAREETRRMFEGQLVAPPSQASLLAPGSPAAQMEGGQPGMEALLSQLWPAA